MIFLNATLHLTHHQGLPMIQRRTLLSATAVAPLAALTGCASQNLAGYASEKPVLDLTQYFNGTVDAHGIFQGRSGQIARRFTVVMECSWKGNEGVLDEAFTYSDGPTQRRIWRLTKLPGGHYTGTADDVVGQAKGPDAGQCLSLGLHAGLAGGWQGLPRGL